MTHHWYLTRQFSNLYILYLLLVASLVFISSSCSALYCLKLSSTHSSLSISSFCFSSGSAWERYHTHSRRESPTVTHRPSSDYRPFWVSSSWCRSCLHRYIPLVGCRIATPTSRTISHTLQTDMDCKQIRSNHYTCIIERFDIKPKPYHTIIYIPECTDSLMHMRANQGT